MPLATTVRFDFVDEKGKTSFTKVRVPTALSLSQAAQFGVALGQLISNISQCRITGISTTFAIDLSGLGLKTVISSVADIAQKGYFAFRSVVTGFFKRLRIPTFDETKVNAGSDAIDTLDVEVAAFQAAMEDGIAVTGGTIQPCTERVQELTALSEAREVFQRKR
jgi:hypothetical protein